VRSFKLSHVMCVLALLVGGLVLPPDALAQRHRGRVVVAVGYPYYSPFYWGSYYGSPFWGPFGYWPPFGYYGGYYDYASDVRVMATPREAEVYVDGYLVGTVDDFDGWSQRLRLQPGEHEIELYLEGHRSVRQKMLFRPGETYKIRAALEKIAAGDERPVRPAPASDAAQPRGPDYPPPPDRGYQPPPASAPRAGQRGFGTLAIRVQPADAVVVVDGERWDRPDSDPRLSVELSAGTHQVEVRKDGHKTYASSVQVRAGEVTTLNVSLPVEP
jgi:PEGA domain